MFDNQGNGVLIDRIDCAANPLVSPIDNIAITLAQSTNTPTNSENTPRYTSPPTWCTTST